MGVLWAGFLIWDWGGILWIGFFWEFKFGTADWIGIFWFGKLTLGFFIDCFWDWMLCGKDWFGGWIFDFKDCCCVFFKFCWEFEGIFAVENTPGKALACWLIVGIFWFWFGEDWDGEPCLESWKDWTGGLLFITVFPTFELLCEAGVLWVSSFKSILVIVFPSFTIVLLNLLVLAFEGVIWVFPKVLAASFELTLLGVFEALDNGFDILTVFAILLLAWEFTFDDWFLKEFDLFLSIVWTVEAKFWLGSW